jgi:hypothetical protein
MVTDHVTDDYPTVKARAPPSCAGRHSGRNEERLVDISTESDDLAVIAP